MNELLESIPEKYKGSIILFLVGLFVGTAGIGWSGLFRDDPFYGSDGKELAKLIAANKTESIRYVNENYISKGLHNEKHAILNTRLDNIEKRDEESRRDIRQQYKLITEVDATHPPPWFEKKVNDNKLGLSELILRVKHLEKVHALWSKAKVKQ